MRPSLLLVAAAVALAATPARALPPRQRICDPATVAGVASASVVVQPAGSARCPLARRVVATWLKTHRTRIGPWRCTRIAHRRDERSDQVAACAFANRSTIWIDRGRRTCGLLYRGPRPPVLVEIWGVRHTRCGTAERLVRAFLDRPRVRRAGWTCHVPAPAAFTAKRYRVGCRRGADAGVYGFDAE